MRSHLEVSRRSTSLFIAVLLLSLVNGAAELVADELSQVTHDGLHLVPDTEVAAAWVKPDADFSGYDKFLILDAYVAFKKNWVIEKNRSSVQTITQRDIEQIKGAMADLFHEVFVEELGTNGRYTVVESPASDVLLLRPAIIDLDVTAPDLDTVSAVRTFAASAGAATLYLELYDSVSGEILARVLDRQAANNAGHIMRYTNKVTNRAAAKEILAGWAGLLRSRMDEIHASAEAPGEGE